MKSLGIFEIKTKLSQVCDDVARTNEAVLVTKRGKPFVRIVPLSSRDTGGSEVWETRERYAGQFCNDEDLFLPERDVDPVYNPFTNQDF